MSSSAGKIGAKNAPYQQCTADILRNLRALTLFAGGFHALSGVYGDWFIGLTPSDVVDPSLDSQNRFYGAAFLLYGILFIFCSRELPRYADIMKIAFGTMFLAGCARGLTVAAYGWPTWQVCVLWFSEITLPPIAWLWLNHELKKPTVL